MNYKRKFYIKSLYSSKQILNKFDHIEFQSVNTFLLSLQEDYFVFTNEFKRLFINVNTIDELMSLSTFISGVEKVDNLCNLFIKINFEVDNLINILQTIGNKRWFLFVKYDDTKMDYYSLLNKEFNNVIIDTTINNQNYVEIFNNIPEITLKYDLKNYFFNIDYYSFEDITISEMYKLDFFINNISYWSYDINFNKNGSVPITCYLSDDFKIYPSNTAFKDGFFIFDLEKNKNFTAEDIPYRELNIFLAYADLPVKILFQGDLNYRLIDLYQNYKIYGVYHILPMIASKFIGRIK